MSIDRSKYMSPDETRQLRTSAEALAALDLKHGRLRGPLAWMLVDLALGTGLRSAELAMLQVEQIDIRRCCLNRVVRCKKKRRAQETLAISRELIEHLKDYTHGLHAGPIFVGKRGPLTAQGLQRIWEKAVAMAGLPAEYTIHSARHTLAVALLKKTGNLRQVQKQLGHAKPEITANMYADVAFEDMQAGVTGLY